MLARQPLAYLSELCMLARLLPCWMLLCHSVCLCNLSCYGNHAQTYRWLCSSFLCSFTKFNYTVCVDFSMEFNICYRRVKIQIDFILKLGFCIILACKEWHNLSLLVGWIRLAWKLDSSLSDKWATYDSFHRNIYTVSYKPYFTTW